MGFCSVFLFVSLITFDANDPSLNHVISVGSAIQNKAGLLGAYTSGFLNDVLGVVAYILPLTLCATAVVFLSSSKSLQWWRWCGFFLLTLCLLLIAAATDITVGDMTAGGMVGATLYKTSLYFLSPVGATLLWLFVFMIGFQLSANLSWLDLYKKAHVCFLQILSTLREVPQHDTIVQQSKEVSSTPQLARIREFYEKYCSIEKLKNILGNIRPVSAPIPELLAPPEEVEPQKNALANENTKDDDFLIDDKEEVRPHAALAPEDGETLEVRAPEVPVLQTTEHKVLHEKTDKPQTTNNVLNSFSDNNGQKKTISFPSFDLLSCARNNVVSDQSKIKAMGKDLMACLGDFAVEGELVRITPGPVVTLFEVLPARGTPVRKIANLSDDLARALKASAVRILAPVPDSDTVGIEIPNEHREGVSFRELAISDEFARGCGPLTIVLGKDTAGRPYFTDLTTMPHMLIGGATGQGKSVCLNSILASFLFRNHPDDLKLLLIDPKRVELAIYADEPHLVHPVVTEVEDAKNALLWATQEMDNRFKALGKLNVRNIQEYNRKLASFKNSPPPELADLKPLPYLVIVIDELADLMITARKDVEPNLVRLAQLARAAGIHMILATQRPSVDVVTGLIKANFPCRISFYVFSNHDSKTILDQAGAEKLLGRGDMLFKPSSGKVKRLHGPYLSEDEVQKIVEHWKKQMTPSYQVDFSQLVNKTNDGIDGEFGGGAAGDALYGEVQSYVMEQGRASISLIQRRFRIGFNRAARLVEQLEQDGIIGPANGSNPRSVVR